MGNETVRLTMAQALVRFLDNQYVELDGRETKFVNNLFGVFGHGCVVGVGQALSQGGHHIRFLQGKNEQNMALAAMAFAKQRNRLEIIPCVSSIGPGAMNMVTAAGCATANRIPLLLLPGDTFACRQPDPVLQQAEFFTSFGQTVTDAFRGVCHYFDRIERPEQLMTAAIHAMRVLTDPADTGAVCLAMPQDVEGEAYDYPVSFLRRRVWHMDRRIPTASQIERAAELIRGSKRPLVIAGGGVRYSFAGDALKTFCETTGIPFSETQAGKSVLPWNHPLNLGGIGVTGGQAANVIAREADCIIAVGTRLTDFTTSSKWLFRGDAKVVSINICPFDAVKMDGKPIICDALEGLTSSARSLGTITMLAGTPLRRQRRPGMPLWMSGITRRTAAVLRRPGPWASSMNSCRTRTLRLARPALCRGTCSACSVRATGILIIWNTVFPIWAMRPMAPWASNWPARMPRCTRSSGMAPT